MHLALRASLLALCASRLQAQWIPQQSNTTASLRGLSVVSARVAWASGSGGTVIRTIDGGATWITASVPDATQRDLRAIAAFDDQHAVVAATAGRIWRTDNGGTSWSLVYQTADTSVFLDAIGFWPSAPSDRAYARARGLVLADPIDGRFLILASDDGGRTWGEAPRDARPIAQPGEAAFAASGTSLVMHDSTRAWIGSGESTARVFRTTDRGKSWVVASTPLSGPTGSAGVFSLSFADALHGIAIGGDFSIEGGRDRNVALTRDGGVTWEPTAGTPPNGYRSAVAIVPQTRGPVAVAVGPTGTDVSLDGGRNWTPADTVGYHAVRFAPDGAGWPPVRADASRDVHATQSSYAPNRTMMHRSTAFALVAATGLTVACGESRPRPAGDSANSVALPNAAASPAPSVFYVRFETSKGPFVVEAHRDWAPHGVDRFYHLVQSEYFDNVRFFRVVSSFMAQFGMHGEPKVHAAWDKLPIPDDSVVESNRRGYVSFAMAGPNTRTTQLFINTASNRNLDESGFAPIGRIVEGMSVVDSLFADYGDAPPGGQGPDQERITAEGNAYLEREFPKLDFIRTARVVSDSTVASRRDTSSR